ncbi:NETI motif-containing protein [Virgibacillus sp. MSP4-1]|uniref:NETI motif-containing protein n=1 Tax=Virgibacillus sp. MSP4-1 TaxID=2700081 RepID=UPI0005C66E18|nr:NETI motif-containing protein [Virgibacillus sp. MSP4-1]QHS24181.1 NETI motif-containing protein [Virgibacillus sp. MSP4-1]
MAKKKKKFKVEENETIHDCLTRMDNEGYRPVKRFEKPVFQETDEGVEPVRQEIIFDAVPKE